MKRLKWESTEWGWRTTHGRFVLGLTERFDAILCVNSTLLEQKHMDAKTEQGAKRAAVQWAKRVVRELAKEWE